MHIAIWNNEKFYETGDLIPESYIISTVPHGEVVLGPGEQNPEGEDVLVYAEAYIFDNKRYDLGDDYSLKAVVRENMLIPKLRASKGQEQYATTRMKKLSQRHKAFRTGDKLLTWPIIEKMWVADKELEGYERIVEEAVITIKEVNEITEDFVLTEYVEDVDE